MKIGLIGLGKMGQAIAYRLLKHDFELYAYDPFVNKDTIVDIIYEKDTTTRSKTINNLHIVSSLNEITKNVSTIWLMVPAGDTTDEVVNNLYEKLNPNSTVIDGGNSFFENSVRRYNKLKSKNINFLDCGTSGGVAGKFEGYSLMIGGDKEVFERNIDIFRAIAAPNGFGYMGPSGAGHYVKMIHNGIEYSILQAYAEGFNLLKNNSRYKNLNLEIISKTWQHGSVIRSWILDLCFEIFKEDQELTGISGEIAENNTGRWTIEEAKKQEIPMILLEDALNIRKQSRETGGNFGTKVVAMLRNKFGGHAVKKNK